VQDLHGAKSYRKIGNHGIPREGSKRRQTETMPDTTAAIIADLATDSFNFDQERTFEDIRNGPLGGSSEFLPSFMKINE
jgi:hypothetical protein